MKNTLSFYSRQICRILLGLSILLCCSCNYLDVAPPEKPTVSNGFDTEAKGLGFLLSCYSGLDAVYASQNAQPELGFSKAPSWMTDYNCQATDETIPYFGWQTTTLQMLQGNVTPSMKWTSDWTIPYTMLKQCYLFEEELAKVTASWLTPDLRNRWLGEIAFLKGFWHLYLLQYYGPIPIMESLYDANASGSDLPGRSHFDYCVDRIAQWLDEAAAVLPAKIDNTEWRRATSTICKALKARLFLYAASPIYNGSFPYPNWRNTNYETPGYGKELVSRTYDPQKWDRALAACKEALGFALNEGGCSLFGYNAASRTQDFTDIDRLMNAEGLTLDKLKIDDRTDENFLKSVMLMRYLLTTIPSDGNREFLWQMGDYMQGREVLIMPYNIIKDSNGSMQGGWVGSGATLYSIEHFYTKDGKLPEYDPEFTPKTEYFQSADLSNKNIIKLNHNREPRFYATFSFDGDQYSPIIVDGEPLTLQTRVSSLHGYAPNRGLALGGYYIKKWIQPDIRYKKADGKASFKRHFAITLRLAELYLNLAECYAALGHDAEAMDALNPIRIRAGVPELTAQMVAESGMSITEWVRSERFIELWGEMHRYYDLRRWLIAPQRMDATSFQGLNAQVPDPTFEEFNQRITLTNLGGKWHTRMYLLPIAEHEVYSNPNLEQAPGY
ncbi:SusD family protein [Bacteroides xylanisolvens]|jgi:susD homolog|uniref:RagB/SusD family nutrient uptake outer membrane protein n=1 Tax=Bacteroides TaxID=816 RepID=UPI00189BFB0E|nr:MULTISPECIES: RagB/SusD family nutrient uptake outer membrane protein [Bacteroides]MCI9522126.1 RagB/SusD family nutrient uptake outer membrane protein [Bacteroides xylanisolvens]MCS2867829.1 RagB/SusD family nutrient uptake outer membrane protein [Bacteroides xylanisolvens]MCS3341450.1 RagB/SusD family nutrient uptake outer membrane protein [Bacteroides xylanisolvens]QRM99782.1 RagB/SusD family nutrient uptake outer membrane protein [Bacteroides xylanisolvens]QUT31422.1 SusD family protein